MLSERTMQAEQRPKLARFGEMVRIITQPVQAPIEALAPAAMAVPKDQEI
jgi:hypothetical protein